jgi:hypothetical protein
MVLNVVEYEHEMVPELALKVQLPFRSPEGKKEIVSWLTGFVIIRLLFWSAARRVKIML